MPIAAHFPHPHLHSCLWWWLFTISCYTVHTVNLNCMPRRSLEFHHNIYYAHVVSPPPIAVGHSPRDHAVFSFERLGTTTTKKTVFVTHFSTCDSCGRWFKRCTYKTNVHANIYSSRNCWFIYYDWPLVHRYCLRPYFKLPSPFHQTRKVQTFSCVNAYRNCQLGVQTTRTHVNCKCTHESVRAGSSAFSTNRTYTKNRSTQFSSNCKNWMLSIAAQIIQLSSQPAILSMGVRSKSVPIKDMHEWYMR